MQIFEQDDAVLIDVSHTIRDGELTYQGLPAPIVCDYLTREASQDHYAEGVTFHIGKIEMVANTGTYVDSPFHRYADGRDLSELLLSSLANLDTVVFDVPADGRAIGPEVFADNDVDLMGKAVLLRTGWSRHWATDEYFSGHPYLTAAAAEYLRERWVALVGIDSYNIDDTADDARPAHSILLGADIPIVEHLSNLSKLPQRGFKFFAVPVKVAGMGTFPVRAFAIVPKQG